jgi:hypothetical protein
LGIVLLLVLFLVLEKTGKSRTRTRTTTRKAKAVVYHENDRNEPERGVHAASTHANASALELSTDSGWSQ